MGIKLTKSEITQYQNAFDELYFHSLSDAIEHYKSLYEKITIPIKNPKFANSTKEEFFYYLSLNRHYDLLCLGYYLSLQQENPQVFLDSFYTYNYLKSLFQLDSGTDHSITFKDVILCYAGNNISLVEAYLSSDSPLSCIGSSFNVIGTNLIIALRNSDLRKEVLKQTESYLSKRNSQFDTAIILTLYGILSHDHKVISDNLNLVVKNHKKSKWLHDFNNDIGKFMPFLAYGLYSIAYFYLSDECFKQIILEKNNILWEGFIELNQANEFSEGRRLLEFDGCLNFLH